MSKEQNSNFSVPNFTIRQLLEAGVHFGHKTMRRNPKMSKYIFTEKNNISIIDLNQTANLLNKSLNIVKDVARNNGKILFVATKKQASDAVASAAKRCGQYYVNFRWLGGMLTNWKTVSQSIKTLKAIEEQLSDNEIGFNKKEKLDLERKRLKLEKTLGGIKTMGGFPDLIFIIDINKESLALQEASKLNIPVMAIIDTNCNTDDVTFPIPGNDDSTKSIKLFCRLLSDAAIAGFKENLVNSGVDISKIESDYESMLAGNSEQNKAKEKAIKTESNKIVVEINQNDKADKNDSKRPKKDIIKKASSSKSKKDDSAKKDNKKISASSTEQKSNEDTKNEESSNQED